jgi:hypothetical protein
MAPNPLPAQGGTLELFGNLSKSKSPNRDSVVTSMELGGVEEEVKEAGDESEFGPSAGAESAPLYGAVAYDSLKRDGKWGPISISIRPHGVSELAGDVRSAPSRPFGRPLRPAVAHSPTWSQHGFNGQQLTILSDILSKNTGTLPSFTEDDEYMLRVQSLGRHFPGLAGEVAGGTAQKTGCSFGSVPGEEGSSLRSRSGSLEAKSASLVSKSDSLKSKSESLRSPSHISSV